MNCVKCGKEIENGAAFCPFCGSNQAVAQSQPVQQQTAQNVNQTVVPKQPASGIGEAFQSLFKGLFSNPADTFKKVVQDANIVMALIFVAVQSIFSGLMLIGMVKGLTESDSLGYIFRYMDVAYGKVFFMGFLCALGINALMALFAYVFMGVVPKTDLTFSKAFAGVGLKALMNAPFLFLAFPFGILSGWVGLILCLLGMALGYIALYGSVCDKDKTTAIAFYGKFFAAASIILSSALWIWVLFKLFS